LNIVNENKFSEAINSGAATESTNDLFLKNSYFEQITHGQSWE
jgi:hypothetical protein